MLYLTEEEIGIEDGVNAPSKKFLIKAQDKVDELTYNRIVYIGFERLTEYQQKNIKKNMLKLAEYYEELDKTGVEGNISSYTVLDISVTLDSEKNKEDYREGIPKSIYKDLMKTGLMTRRM